MKRQWKLWLVPLAILLVLGAFKINAMKPQQEDQAGSAAIQAVKTTRTQKITRQEALPGNGTVDPVQKAVITARVAGIVEALQVDNGTGIQAGQTLVQIDDAPYASLVTVCQAALTQAQTKLSNTRSTYNRLQQLHQGGAVSDKDFEDIRAALTVAEADVSSALSALSNAERDQGYTRVSSPIGGLVANRNVVLGQMVAQGTPLMEVQDLSEVFVLVKLGQNEVGKIRAGQTAEITVDAYPDQEFNGVVSVINPAADPEARAFVVKVRVPNPEGQLKSGMFAKVTIFTAEAHTILAVPQEALTSKQGQFYVFVPEGDLAKIRTVTIGEAMDGWVEVRGGLEEGQDVISTNVNKLKEDDHIQVTTGQEV